MSGVGSHANSRAPHGRLGPYQDEVRSGPVEHEVRLTAQHPAGATLLGGDGGVAGLVGLSGLSGVESGHGRGERAVRDPRQVALACVPVAAVQQGVGGEGHRGQQGRAVQGAPGFLQGHGQFGEREARPAVLLRHGQSVDTDLAA